MLPHPLLASEDDEDYVIRVIVGLPELLDEFFECLEAVYIEAKGAEYSTRASTLYLTIQRQLQVLSLVPKESYCSFSGDKRQRKVDEKLPKLLDGLSRLFLEDVVGVGPQALSWKRPCQRLARGCADHMRLARIEFSFLMKMCRQLVTFNSSLFLFVTITFGLVVLFNATMIIVLPSLRPSRQVGVPIGCVSALLLCCASAIFLVNNVIATRALSVLYSRLLESHMIMADSSPFLHCKGKVVGGGSRCADPLTETSAMVKIQQGKHARKGYYTIPYGHGVGFIDGKQLDSQVVMIAYDRDFLITRWNNAAEVITGFLEAGCVGKPLSELVQCPNGDSICDELRRARKSTMIKIKLRALAMAPSTLNTMVAPIANPEGEHVGSILICANAKDNLREYRNYLHSYQVSETGAALRLLSERRTLAHEDNVLVATLRQFVGNSLASHLEEHARDMVTEWEWTNPEQFLGRALGQSIGSHEVVVDSLFPPTLCISPLVGKVVGMVVSLSGSHCTVNLQNLNLTGNVFSMSVTVIRGDGWCRSDQEKIEELLKPLLRQTAGNAYYLGDRIVLHFPCQVAAIVDDDDHDQSASEQAKQLAQARTIINCSVNVITAISNMVDQHNVSFILLKTMFVTLASVQNPSDLEQRLTVRPCDVDVVICDSKWLSSARDQLLSGTHGAIIIPLVDSEAPLSQHFSYVIRMPIVGREVLAMMFEVGKKVSMKKGAATARIERERILTLRQDSPWTKGRLLGRGSYGAVYEATSDLTGGKMAVKMFYFSGDREDSINQLLNEIQIMCSLNHPNIVHYFHCERKDNNVSLFMELCQASLTDIIVGLQKKPAHLTVVSIIRQVLSAIAYLHSRGIAHRDIKPQNILLKGETIKLTDFGTARQGDSTKEVRGTFRYMAPEVFTGQPHSLSCDIWSIGCLVCELFACPPRFMEHATLLCEISSITGYLQDVPLNPLLRDFLYKCFKLEPEQRSTSHDLLTHPLLSNHNLSAEVDTLPTVFDGKHNRQPELMVKSAFSISSV